MQRLIATLAAASLSLSLGAAHAELAIISHKDNPVSSIQPSDLARIFLGKASKFPGGETAVPVDQADGSAVYSEFYEKVANKTPSQLKAYWSRLIFTGKGQPPRAISSTDEVKELVSSNPNLVGYIESSAVDDSVKVLLTIP